MSAYGKEALVKLLREGWRGDVATDLMREAADEIEALAQRAGCVEAIRRDVYGPLRDILRREASLGVTIEPPADSMANMESYLGDLLDRLEQAEKGLSEVAAYASNPMYQGDDGVIDSREVLGIVAAYQGNQATGEAQTRASVESDPAKDERLVRYMAMAMPLGYQSALAVVQQMTLMIQAETEARRASVVAEEPEWEARYEHLKKFAAVAMVTLNGDPYGYRSPSNREAAELLASGLGVPVKQEGESP